MGDRRNFVAAVRALSSRPRFAVISASFVLFAVLASGARYLTPADDLVAVWWPAAGVGVAVTLFATSRRWLVALALGPISFAILLIEGRPLSLALIGLVATSVEAFVTAEIIVRGPWGVGIATVRDALWFLVAAAMGALVLGVVGSALVWIALGVEPQSTFVASVLSHFSAMLLIVPLVLVGPSPWRIRALEGVIQIAALAAVVVAVFSPAQTLPVAFLPIPVLMWAAFRFPFFVVLVEVLATGIVVMVLSFGGGGPFAAIDAFGTGSVGALLQLYAVTLGGSVLVLAASRNEREVLLARVAAADRALRLGLSEAQVGLLSARKRGDQFEIIDSNAAGLDLLGVHAGFAGHELRAAIGSLELASSEGEGVAHSHWEGEWDDPLARHLHVRIARVPALDGGTDYTIQVLDATAKHLAEAAMTSALLNERATATALSAVYKKQDDFVASVSHELRTPISSVLGFSEVLADSTLDDQQRSQLAVISRNANRLLLLVNNLLKLAELDSGGELHRAQARPVAELMNHCVEDVTVLAQSQSVAVVYEPAMVSIATTEYPTEVSQILTNLLSNAIKFTPAGGTVTLSVKESATEVVVSISDTGVGIPPEELDSMTERFVRSSRSGSVGGTGLGLAIASKLATALGGSLSLESDGVSGTAAHLTLPIEWVQPGGPWTRA